MNKYLHLDMHYADMGENHLSRTSEYEDIILEEIQDEEDVSRSQFILMEEN